MLSDNSALIGVVCRTVGYRSGNGGVEVSVETTHPLQRKRILIVSDSVGTPIQPRGIFHYTTNLMRALHACGHDLCLLVEDAPLHAIPAREQRQLDQRWPPAARCARLASIYNYLWEPRNIGRYPTRRNLRWLVARLLHWPSQAISLLSLAGVKLLLRRRVVLRARLVVNDVRQLDFVPTRLTHLPTCSHVLLSEAVYSLAFASSALGVGAPTIDARGFDVILVDTPSYFRFERSPGSEIVAVVHDLIPLADPTMPRVWRRAFVNKIGAVLTGADSLIFVSESTRSRFHELFPEPMATRATILYPSVADDFGHGQDPSALRSHYSTEPNAHGYVLAIVSDEPRKNIANLVSAWSLLPQGIALKIVGDVEPERYRNAADPGSRIEILGYVDDDTKQRLIADAAAVIVPSFAEGFGIPIAEAMFFGKPVMCSDIPVFREVAGEHAAFFDPYSPAAIAAAVADCIDHPNLYRERASAARELARSRFSVSALTARVAQRFGTSG